MKRIKNIVFDFGGVLLDWNPRYLYRTFFGNDKEMDYFLTHICTEQWNAQQDKGRSFAEGIEILQSQHPEYREAIGLFIDKWGDMLKCDFPESVEMLRNVKREGFRVFGLTNTKLRQMAIRYQKSFSI